jgi:hypothetical protein
MNNSPADNRWRLVRDRTAPGRKRGGDHRWEKMLLSWCDINYAMKVGMVGKAMDDGSTYNLVSLEQL